MSEKNEVDRQSSSANDTGYDYVANLAALLPEIPVDSIVSRTFYSDDGIKGIIFGFAEGQELSEHTASRPAILHILSGDAALTLGEDSFEAKAGSWVRMEAKLPHSVVAQSAVVMLLLLLP